VNEKTAEIIDNKNGNLVGIRYNDAGPLYFMS